MLCILYRIRNKGVISSKVQMQGAIIDKKNTKVLIPSIKDNYMSFFSIDDEEY